ncbi:MULTISPECIES: hypothetical protein [unclassified Rhodococcus (in: high G+C Gram-positive bacteria)]|uniref:hypothetical protein n=1 Tax=unclassified Rhodococcus (in: high G+C Gram-positive bacteria) TaxID=192944 RepID=UPI0033982D31
MDGLLDFYRRRRSDRRDQRTQERRLGYAREGRELMKTRSEEHREEARLAELAGDWQHAQIAWMLAGAADIAGANASVEVMERADKLRR